MDLSYLYERRGISLFMAENASGETLREIHWGFGERDAARAPEPRHLRNREAKAHG